MTFWFLQTPDLSPKKTNQLQSYTGNVLFTKILVRNKMLDFHPTVKLLDEIVEQCAWSGAKVRRHTSTYKIMT